LLYVDDNILFCSAKHEEAKVIMKILNTYQEASGQRINMDKSKMIFGPNISLEHKKKFQDNLPIKISDNIQKYMGMPT